MNIALIGYGSMGQAVHRLALKAGHAVPVIIDPSNNMATHQQLSSDLLKDIDVAIDFSTRTETVKNIKICLESGTNLIMGTTGWHEQLEEIKKLVASGTIGFLHSANFAIGVNVYMKIVEAAAKLMDRFDEYDIWGHEIHHFNKADSPSGTAKSLAKILLTNIHRKTKVVDEIHFSSVRGGAVNFAHTIGFDSEADTITITHAARNRDGYALGAIKAAEWLQNKKGYYEMNDFLNF